MSGSYWRKTLVYLGLVEEPDEYEELTAAPPPPRDDEPARGRSRRALATDGADREPYPEPLPSEPERASNVRPLRAAEAAHLRPMNGATPARVSIVEVGSFDDCEVIGVRYRAGQPVVFDLGAVDAPVARRVLDFVSGVTYALRGQLTRVGERAFLLVPAGVEVTDDEQRRLVDLGYGGVAR
jgi:cell division inhibitor SepF